MIDKSYDPGDSRMRRANPDDPEWVSRCDFNSKSVLLQCGDTVRPNFSDTEQFHAHPFGTILGTREHLGDMYGEVRWEAGVMPATQIVPLWALIDGLCND